MGDRFEIRSASPNDLPEIVAIERAAFSDPWSEPTFTRLIGPFASVLVEDGSAIGYLFGRIHGDKAEILNLAVHPERRRRGIASRLLEESLAGFERAGARRVVLEVRESNSAARALYRMRGFREVGHRPGYYCKPNEDAVLMRRFLTPQKRLA